jgi:hypothetical protein
VRIQYDQPSAKPRNHLEEFDGPVEVIQQSRTKYRIEHPVFLNIPNVVPREVKIREIQMSFDVFACREVAPADFDTQSLEPHAGKFDGVPSLEAAEVDDALPGHAVLESDFDGPLCRQEPRKLRCQKADIRLGERPVIEPDIVMREADH